MHPSQVSLKETQSIDEFRYHGHPCSKNPEHGTIRYKRNNHCVGCQRETNRAARKTEAGRAKHNAACKRRREDNALAHQRHKKIQHDTRMKAIEIAYKKFNDGARWKDCWVEAIESMKGQS